MVYCCEIGSLFLQGFKKIDPDKWEFANEAFLKDHKDLLRNIKRRRAPSHPQEPLSTYNELEGLRRDKRILLMELMKLKQQQQSNRADIQAMELRLQRTETSQQQMMNLFARAVENPTFINQLVQGGKRNELEEGLTRKRQRSIDQGPRTVGLNSIKVEPTEFRDSLGFQVSELEALALEMQGFGRARKEHNEDVLEQYDNKLDVGFWEELLNEGFDEELGNRNEELVSGVFLGSSTK